MEESCVLKASLRTCTPISSTKDEASDLINSQINFGRAYIQEARAAYESGNFDYGEIARKIALNAYSAALRFSANLLEAPQVSLVRQIEEFERELDGLLEPLEVGMRSIA
jgi:hypothetical protein